MMKRRTGLRNSSKRKPPQSHDGSDSKRVRDSESEVALESMNKSPGGIDYTRHRFDQSAYCRVCKNLELPQRILDLVEKRRTSFSMRKWGWKKDWDTSCPSCMLGQPVRDNRTRYPPVDGTYFHFYRSSGRPCASEELQTIRISNDLRFSCRKPRKSHPVDFHSLQKVQNCQNIDWSIFRQHFEACRASHPSCRPLKHRHITGLKVIDCHSRKIVQAPEDCAYVVLSYVWGPPSIPLGDVQNLPKTIADAVTVTLALGLDFLWVDRYCINQESKREQHAQIHQMGLIYSQAQLTIIAAAGSDPGHGLPGVSANRAKKGAVTQIGGYDFYVLHDTSQELVADSVWVTRAWTYQEFMLSKRRLFFTDQHAFLQCQTTMIEEWPASAWKNTYVPARQENMGCDLQEVLSFKDDMPDMDRFWTTIERYTKRELTYPSDAMNGIMGVLSDFEDCSPPIHQLMGVPYLCTDIKARLRLDWTVANHSGKKPSNQVDRLPQFPSWSWTGWQGIASLSNLYEQVPVSTVVELRNSTETVTLNQLSYQQRLGEGVEAPQFIWVDGWTIPLELVPHSPKPSEPVIPRLRVLGVVTAEPYLSSTNLLANDIQAGNRQIGTLAAIWIGWRVTPSLGILLFQCLAIEKTTTTTERVGLVTLEAHHGEDRSISFKDALSAFQDQFPMAKRERIRLG